MTRHAEYGHTTFVGTPAQAEAHVSSPTAQGYFAVFAWFDFEEGGGAVFEIRLHVLGGIKDVLRRGPSALARSKDGPDLLQWRLKYSEREGVRYTKCSVLDAALLIRETVALLPASEQREMEVQPWWLGYKNFLLSIHCHMARYTDARYNDESVRLGVWTQRISDTAQIQDRKLSTSDAVALAVQSPYILMFSRTGTSRSDASITSCGGDDLPGVMLLLAIAKYLTWWRELRGMENDDVKAQQNRNLAAALSGGVEDVWAKKARNQLLEAVARVGQSKFSPDLRDYVLRTGNQGFLKNWTSTEMKEMAIADCVLGLAMLPLWLQTLLDRNGVERKALFRPSLLTSEMSNQTPRSSLKLPVLDHKRTPRVRFNDGLSASNISTPRTLAGFPWTAVDEISNQMSRDVNFELGRHFPKRNRTLVPSLDLKAHIEFTGYSYPEFEATSRGKYDVLNDLRNLDAAGLTQRGGGRSVVASQPGVFAQSYCRLNKKDFQTSLDPFVAEQFHRDACATTQQLYLRPEFRGVHNAPVHYMQAIQNTIRKQA
jgi:hypothetical protein